MVSIRNAPCGRSLGDVLVVRRLARRAGDQGGSPQGRYVGIVTEQVPEPVIAPSFCDGLGSLIGQPRQRRDQAHAPAHWYAAGMRSFAAGSFEVRSPLYGVGGALTMGALAAQDRYGQEDQ